MKLVAGRTQDLADIEAIVASGADREFLMSAVQRMARPITPPRWSGCCATSTASDERLRMLAESI
jgi:hypothetical protein